jgi:hypothetical protein
VDAFRVLENILLKVPDTCRPEAIEVWLRQSQALEIELEVVVVSTKCEWPLVDSEILRRLQDSKERVEASGGRIRVTCGTDSIRIVAELSGHEAVDGE